MTKQIIREVRSKAALEEEYKTLAPGELREVMVINKKVHRGFLFLLYRDHKTGTLYQTLRAALPELGHEPKKPSKSNIILPP